MSVDIVCLGILVADVIARPVESLPGRGSLAFVEEIELHGGGCALNTASALVRLGLRSAAMGKVGADPFGDFLLRLLDERGVERGGVLRDPEAVTSASVVLVSEDGERTFLHAPGADNRLGPEELDTEFLFDARHLHVAGAGALERLDGEPLARLLEEAQGRGLVTSLDTVWDATGRWRRVEACLPHLDLACPNLAEAQAVSHEVDPIRVAAFFRGRGVREVVLTIGPRGCYAAGDDFEGYVSAPEVNAIDGTGAGDAFAAGLLYARSAQWPFERAVRFASAAGALATTAVGAFEGVGGLEETLELEGLSRDRAVVRPLTRAGTR